MIRSPYYELLFTNDLNNLNYETYLVIDSDSGSVDSIVSVVLVCRGLERCGEKVLEARLVTLTLVRIPLAKKEEVLGNQIGLTIAQRG